MAIDGKDDVYQKISKALVSLVMLIAVVSVQLWLSAFLYFTFYYMYMPAERFEQPIFLEYSPCRQFNGMESCPFPGSNISLIDDHRQDRVLMRGQKYDVVLDLELPQSPVNERQGVFMVEVSLYSRHGQITTSAAKPAMMKYRSLLLRLLDTLLYYSTLPLEVMMKYRSPLLRLLDTLLYIPFFLLRYADESQTFSVTLLENFVDNPTKPVHGAYIEVRARQIEIYSVNFLIRAQFSGLRYFLFYWPVTSAVCSISFNFSILSIISFLSWGQIWSSGESPKDLGEPWSDPEDEPTRARGDLRTPELRGARKKERRKDVLADLKTSIGSQRLRPTDGRRDVSYCDDSDDDILCTPDSPTRSRSTATKDGSSDSFEAIEDSTEEGAVGGHGEGGARYRGRMSSPD